MLYGQIARKEPFEVAIKKIYEAFTQEDIIGFVSSHEAFRELHRQEYLEFLKTFQDEMDKLEEIQEDIFDLEEELDELDLSKEADKQKALKIKKAIQEKKELYEKGALDIDARRERSEETFYNKRAIKALRDKGFLAEIPDYENLEEVEAMVKRNEAKRQEERLRQNQLKKRAGKEILGNFQA